MTKAKMYDTIIHISDIHIRRGVGRYREYIEVFDNFKDYLKANEKVVNDRAVIVITGDIFHDKGQTDGYSLSLFYKLLGICASSAPTVIIAGNHDMKQEDKDNPDIIEILTKKIKNDNINYFKDTGLYQLGNLGIGVQCIGDILEKGNTTGLNNEIQAFPSPEFSSEIEHKIALCHVAVDEVCGHFRQSSLIPLEHFHGYDFVLLGDIHKRQSGRNWGYSGSLIQQNFGESLLHGGLVWDLNKRVVDTFNLDNPVAYLTIKVPFDKETIVKQIRDLRSQYIHIRTKGALLTSEIKQEVQQMFREVKKTISSWSEVHDKEQCIHDNDDNYEHFRELNTKDMWCSYLKEVVPDAQGQLKSLAIDFVQNYDNYLPKEDLIKKYIPLKQRAYVMSKLENIRNSDVYNGQGQESKKLPFAFIELKWDWLYSFGANNHIQFETYENEIVLLKGKNASGKSNFIEIVLLALFGQTVPSRNNHHFTSYSTIHHRKPKNAISQSQLVFRLGEHRYVVKRKYKASKTSMVIDAVLECPELDLVLKQTAVKNWIKENIGTIQDLLSTTVITQHNDHDFFALREGERTEYLEKSLNLLSISCMNDIIGNMHAVYKQLVSSLEVAKDKYEIEQEGFKDNDMDFKKEELEKVLDEQKGAYMDALHTPVPT